MSACATLWCHEMDTASLQHLWLLYRQRQLRCWLPIGKHVWTIEMPSPKQRWTTRTARGEGWSVWMRWPLWRNSSPTSKNSTSRIHLVLSLATGATRFALSVRVRTIPCTISTFRMCDGYRGGRTIRTCCYGGPKSLFNFSTYMSNCYLQCMTTIMTCIWVHCLVFGVSKKTSAEMMNRY